MDVVKDYDCENLYHLGKANVVPDALFRKVVATSIRDVCLRITMIAPLLEQIREAQAEAMKEEHRKSENIVAQVTSFDGNRGFLTLHQWVWVLYWVVYARF